MTSKNSLLFSNQKLKSNPQFYENNILKEFIDIKISSPNKSIEKIDTTFQTKDKVFSQFKNENNPDSDYNYKKDFLDLSFDQIKDQNNLGYKRKILSNKLMTDLTFTLNKDFEFTFQDKIKNNIITNLSINNNENLNENKNNEIFNNLNNIDNNFILDLCNNNNNFNYQEDNLLEESIESSNSINENSDNYLGIKKTQEEIENIFSEEEYEHVKKNYTPVHCVHIALNFEEDEDFDFETYNFFLNFIKKYEEKPISSKIKLVLSYLNEKNPETGKDIYSNKSKNEILQFWKNEYEIARNKYERQIKEEEKRKKEMKKLKSNKKNKNLNLNNESNYNKSNYISNSNYLNSENKKDENSLNSHSSSNVSSGKYLKYVEIKNNNLKKSY